MSHEGFGSEASQLINVITGYSATTLADVFERAADRPKWNLFVVAPFDYQRWLLERIGREAANATAGKPGAHRRQTEFADRSPRSCRRSMTRARPA
jgi:polyphosphate kinase